MRYLSKKYLEEYVEITTNDNCTYTGYVTDYFPKGHTEEIKYTTIVLDVPAMSFSADEIKKIKIIKRPIMTRERIKKYVLNDAACIEFSCNGKGCGFEFITENGKNIFYLWDSNTTKKFKNIDKAIDCKMFNGLNIIDWLNKVKEYDVI